jgi:hypothetical protein
MDLVTRQSQNNRKIPEAVFIVIRVWCSVGKRGRLHRQAHCLENYGMPAGGIQQVQVHGGVTHQAAWFDAGQGTWDHEGDLGI